MSRYLKDPKQNLFRMKTFFSTSAYSGNQKKFFVSNVWKLNKLFTCQLLFEYRIGNENTLFLGVDKHTCSNAVNTIQSIISDLGVKIFIHVVYSPHMPLSFYRLFCSLQHYLSNQHLQEKNSKFFRNTINGTLFSWRSKKKKYIWKVVQVETNQEILFNN